MAPALRTPEPPAAGKDYRRLLERKAEDVGRGLAASRTAEIVHRLEEPLDFGDWCQKSHDEWLFLNQNRIEIELLRNIQQALRRIDSGTFGICQACERPISPKRLAAIPWARYCLACEESQARGELDLEPAE